MEAVRLSLLLGVRFAGVRHAPRSLGLAISIENVGIDIEKSTHTILNLETERAHDVLIACST